MVKLSILSQDEGREAYQSQNMGDGAKATPKRFQGALCTVISTELSMRICMDVLRTD